MKTIVLLLLMATEFSAASDAHVRDTNMKTKGSAEVTTKASANLKCYQCGTFSYIGDGSVSPCYRYNEKDLKPCADTDTHCVKYMNKGIIVRQCLADCETGTKGPTELYCCQEDGCNGAIMADPEVLAFLSASLVIITYMLLF